MERPTYNGGKDDLSQGAGKVFMTPANVAFSTERLQDTGAVEEAKIKIDEKFFDFVVNGINEAQEMIGREVTIDVEMPAFNYQTLSLVQGCGTTGSDTQTSEAFTNMYVTLYGNNWAALPVENVTISAVTDNGATPNSYATSDIELDGTAGSNHGRIRIPTGSNITASDTGVTLLLTGTYNHGTIDYIDYDLNTTLSKHGIRVKKTRPDGRVIIFDLEECERSAPVQELSFKVGTQQMIKTTYKGFLKTSSEKVMRTSIQR